MATEHELERNITLIKINSALMWGRFFVPVIALFYIASQVTLAEFSIIMAVFTLVTLVLEIPSGYITDRIGYRAALLISRTFYLAEVLLLAFANGFWPLLVAKVLSGIGLSLSSGTQSGLLYESLERLGRENEHKHVRGVQQSITYASMGVTFILGGIIFAVDAKLTAILSLIPLTIGLLLTFLHRDPPVDVELTGLASTVRSIVQSPAIRALFLLALATAGAIGAVLTISSAWLEAAHIPVSLIGVVAFAGAMISALVARHTQRIERALGERRAATAMVFAVILGALMMAFTSPWAVAGLLLLSAALGFYSVIADNYVNSHVHRTGRVTTISVQNMGKSLGEAGLVVLLGLLAATHGYGGALIAHAAAVTILGAVAAVAVNRAVA